jgi:hypothetical protein
MVLNITEEEFFQMKQVLMDEDHEEALRLIKAFHKRLEQQKHQGMKSHLG